MIYQKLLFYLYSLTYIFKEKKKKKNISIVSELENIVLLYLSMEKTILNLFLLLIFLIIIQYIQKYPKIIFNEIKEILR